jgi:hypothetical protein
MNVAFSDPFSTFGLPTVSTVVTLHTSLGITGRSKGRGNLQLSEENENAPTDFNATDYERRLAWREETPSRGRVMKRTTCRTEKFEV